jgi:hypothetical protein
VSHNYSLLKNRRKPIPGDLLQEKLRELDQFAKQDKLRE